MLVYRTLHVLLSISILVGLSPSLLAEKPKITPADRISSGPAVVTSLEAKPSRSWPTTERWTDSSQTLHHQFYIKQRWLAETWTSRITSSSHTHWPNLPSTFYIFVNYRRSIIMSQVCDQTSFFNFLWTLFFHTLFISLLSFAVILQDSSLKWMRRQTLRTQLLSDAVSPTLWVRPFETDPVRHCGIHCHWPCAIHRCYWLSFVQSWRSRYSSELVKHYHGASVTVTTATPTQIYLLTYFVCNIAGRERK